MGTIIQTDRTNSGELRFRKLIENSYAGVSLLDRDLNVIYRSPSAERITGWAGKERTGISSSDLVHPAEGRLFQNLLDSVYGQPGEPFTSRFRVKHYAGHYIWVECTLTNLLDEEYVNAIVFNFVDITRQVELEQEQQRNQAFIRMVTDNLPVMIAYFSAYLRCQFANEPYRAYFGNGGEVIGKLKSELLSATEYSAHENHLTAVLKGKRRSFERNFANPGGSTVYTHTQYLPDGPADNVKGFYSLIYDISEIKVAEREVSRKSAQMEELLNSITDGFVGADAEQRYTYVNKKLCEMVGLEAGQLIGRRIWDVFPEAVGSATYEAIQKALREKRYVLQEDYHPGLDLWQENRIFPNADGFSMFYPGYFWS